MNIFLVTLWALITVAWLASCVAAHAAESITAQAGCLTEARNAADLAGLEAVPGRGFWAGLEKGPDVYRYEPPMLGAGEVVIDCRKSLEALKQPIPRVTLSWDHGVPPHDFLEIAAKVGQAVTGIGAARIMKNLEYCYQRAAENDFEKVANIEGRTMFILCRANPDSSNVLTIARPTTEMRLQERPSTWALPEID